MLLPSLLAFMNGPLQGGVATLARKTIANLSFLACIWLGLGLADSFLEEAKNGVQCFM